MGDQLNVNGDVMQQSGCAEDSSTSSYVMRQVTYDEAVHFKWAVEEKWNPGLHDLKGFFGIDPHGFFTGYLNSEPIACMSLVRHSESYAFVGYYIVKPPHRGKGYGLKLWNFGTAPVHRIDLQLCVRIWFFSS